MEHRLTADSVKVEFSQDEALVLLEWLSKIAKSGVTSSPERDVLADLEAVLERGVNVVFSTRYEEELHEARARLMALNYPDGSQS